MKNTFRSYAAASTVFGRRRPPRNFIADSVTSGSPDHPVLAVDLPDDCLRPFRCIPPELRAAENNLNIVNTDRESFDQRQMSKPDPPILAHW